MTPSREQHRSQGGTSQGGVRELVLFMGGSLGSTAPQAFSRTGRGGQEPSLAERAVPGLAAWGRHQRLQLAALAASRVTLSLRQAVEGTTLLASVLRPPEPRRGASARRRTSRVLALQPTRLVNVLNKEC
jgi:hypothetical protein